MAEELHFGRAADRLSMTQPPLSRQIQKLERSIGARLLERDNRRVLLTAAGEAFLHEARRLLALTETAPDIARRIAAGSAGILRIGFTAASSYRLLGALLNEMAVQLPDLDLDLHEMVTRDQVGALMQGEIDVGLGRPTFNRETLDGRLLLREPLMVVVPVDHRLTRIGRPVTPADLRQEPLIMHSPTRARYFYDLVVSLVPFADENVVDTVTQILTMVFLVAAQRGVAFVPHSATALGVEGVEFLELASAPQNPVELHAIWRKDSHNPALHRLLSLVGKRHGIMPIRHH